MKRGNYFLAGRTSQTEKTPAHIPKPIIAIYFYATTVFVKANPKATQAQLERNTPTWTAARTAEVHRGADATADTVPVKQMSAVLGRRR